MCDQLHLCDIPPEEPGIPYARWAELRLGDLAAAAAVVRPSSEPEINRKAIATPRDRYGWRSLPNGTRMLNSPRAVAS